MKPFHYTPDLLRAIEAARVREEARARAHAGPWGDGGRRFTTWLERLRAATEDKVEVLR